MRIIVFLGVAASLSAAEFPKPFNTGTDVGKKPMAAEEAVKLIEMPKGFTATVFAAEPDVQNPIACTWDSRGRLWVAENYTYADAQTNFDKTLRDRILIFEDTDNDGKADKRTVFADNLENLTSLELGYGGVFVTAAPYVLFIPDRDRDDKPDIQPPVSAPSSGAKVTNLLPGTSYEILLDGFNAGSARHNLVNGLKWGPDGWLYGRQGILAASKVGKPGTPDAERVKFNTAIWKYHPLTHQIEVVTWGGTNSWGHDWTADGTGFFINTVIGHLYQMIPGAHYERMFGEDLNPSIYKLLPQTADHYHFDTKKSWTESRDGKANDLGGGHAHVGCMIYLGTNWPEKYRGKLFTINLHGRRLNVEKLEMQGSSYVGKAEPDVIFFKDPWFRGNELTYGPDGGVYVLDWSDQGECHENDGVHRESGRIYKITSGKVKKANLGPKGDLATLTRAELYARIFAGDEWQSRQALQLCREKFTGVEISAAEHAAVVAEALTLGKEIDPKFDGESSLADSPRASRPMDLWALGQKAGPKVNPDDSGFFADLEDMTGTPEQPRSANARLQWVVALEAESTERRLAVMEHLLKFDGDNGDRVLPLFYWSAFEGYIGGADEGISSRAVNAVMAGKIRQVREFTARKITEGATQKPARLNELLDLAVKSFDEPRGKDVVRGLSAALRGVQRMAKPASWDAFAAKAAQIPVLADQLRNLQVIFGDGQALAEIRSMALDGKAPLASRRQALESLITSKDADLRTVSEKLVENSDLTLEAIRGLATFDDQKAADLAVASYGRARDSARPAAMGALCSQPRFARALLLAIEKGSIAKADLTPYHARQVAALADSSKDADLAATLKNVWGEVRTTPADKQRKIADLRARLTPELLAKADIDKGRAAFNLVCASCHTLYDLGQAGTNLGPNLTGSGRTDLGYLLENMVDPSALVPADYKMSVVTLKDGRVLSGFISKKTDQTLTLRTLTEIQSVSVGQVEKIDTSTQSLMPEGLLDALTVEQQRDLFGFLLRK